MTALAFIPAVVFALQSASFKQYGLKCDNSFGATSLFTTIYLALSAVLVLPFIFIFNESVSPESLMYGAAFGVFFFVFIIMYGEAIKSGPLSVTTFIFSISMVIPIVLSLILFEEPISAFQIAGFVLMLVGIYFINFANRHRKAEEKTAYSKKWIIYCIIGAVFNAATMFTNKLFGIKVVGGSVYQYLCVACVIATILSLFTFALPKAREGIKTVNIDKWFIILAVIVAAANVGGNGMVAYLGGILTGSVMFPIINGVSVSLSCMLSVFFFKEKLNKRAVIGLIIGVIAIVFLSL